MHTALNGAAHPSYCLNSEVFVTLRFYNLLYSNATQQLFNKLPCYQSNHYENSVVRGSHHMSPPCLQLAVSKDEWDTKEDTGKSMKNALYVQWYGKRHLLG